MREILFKAISKETGEWIEGDLMRAFEGDNENKTFICDRPILNSLYGIDGTFIDMDDMHEVDPSTVCQFTGLLDSKGVKIFEGDKVFYADLTGESGHATIEHWAGGFVFEWGKNNFKSPTLITSAIYMACPSELTVTGSIHNKEPK
jgi:uncharacterized phage protein (TIGR01671 family)